ncbi:hypothetical protein A2U01_0026886, partial [Trifolium medium]|nr:hypothetical protein [Trifolium medium]
MTETYRIPVTVVLSVGTAACMVHCVQTDVSCPVVARLVPMAPYHKGIQH